MNEAYLRKWHRRMGIGLALFFLLQAGSGLALNWESLSGLPTPARWASLLHRGGGEFGAWYRSLLGLGLLGMAASGSWIFYKIRQRTRRP